MGFVIEILTSLNSDSRVAGSVFFFSRRGISLCFTTNKAIQIPTDYQERTVSWLQFNQGVGRYSLGNIRNMDQTLLPFEYLSGRIYAIRGDKTVHVWAKGNEKWLG